MSAPTPPLPPQALAQLISADIAMCVESLFLYFVLTYCLSTGLGVSRFESYKSTSRIRNDIISFSLYRISLFSIMNTSLRSATKSNTCGNVKNPRVSDLYSLADAILLTIFAAVACIYFLNRYLTFFGCQ